jgi:hypothetical protein
VKFVDTRFWRTRQGKEPTLGRPSKHPPEFRHDASAFHADPIDRPEVLQATQQLRIAARGHLELSAGEHAAQVVDRCCVMCPAMRVHAADDSPCLFCHADRASHIGEARAGRARGQPSDGRPVVAGSYQVTPARPVAWNRTSRAAEPTDPAHDTTVREAQSQTRRHDPSAIITKTKTPPPSSLGSSRRSGLLLGAGQLFVVPGLQSELDS